jgi:hypothetical protein
MFTKSSSTVATWTTWIYSSPLIYTSSESIWISSPKLKSDFPQKVSDSNSIFVSSRPIVIICPAHLFFFDMMILIIFCEEYYGAAHYWFEEYTRFGYSITEPAHWINTNNRLQGDKPFLKTRQLCSYSTISQHFMKPWCSLPCSQEFSTGPYAEPDQSSPHNPILSL